MSVVADGRPVPPDPWTAIERSTDPRLCAFVAGRTTKRGAYVVELSAALWGGHHARHVTLTPGQAYDLARQLDGLVGDALGGKSRPGRLVGSRA